MKHQLFNLCAFTSALLCLGLLALWANSISGSAWMRWVAAPAKDTVRVAFASVARHQIMIGRQHTIPSPQGFSAGVEIDFGDASIVTAEPWGVMLPSRPSLTTFFIYREPTAQMLLLPIWPLVLATTIPPTFWLIARRRRRLRQLAGHCVECDYDLRATPARCPECGRVPVAPHRRRWVFHSSAAASTVLMIAVSVLWVRGGFVRDEITHTTYWSDDARQSSGVIRHKLIASSGRIGWTYRALDYTWTSRQSIDWDSHHRQPSHWTYKRGDPQWHRPDTSLANRLGFGRGGTHLSEQPWENAGELYQRFAFAPCWFIMLLSAILPTLWLVNFVQRRRTAQSRLIPPRPLLQ